MSRYDVWLDDIPDSDITGIGIAQTRSDTEISEPNTGISAPETVLVDFDEGQTPPETGMPDNEQSERPPQAMLPPQLSTHAPDASLKPRYQGHAPLNDLVRQDWIKVIEDDPDCYDALLYRPVENDAPTVQDAGLETPVFTEFNNHQRELSYADPQKVTVLDCPDERESFTAVDADDNQDGGVEDFLVIRAAAPGVPVGAIFEWNEALSDGGIARRFWYVLRIFTYGTASVGSLYYCIPARNFSQSAWEADHAQQ